MSDSSISLGLDAIFNSIDNAEDTNDKSNELKVASIRKSPYQARKKFSSSEITELSNSIKQHGILQPLLVRETNLGAELIAGERRLRAAILLNLDTVPVVWCSATDELASAFGLIENIQRKNLNALEEAEAYKKLIDDYGLSHEDLSYKLAKSRSHITNILRLTKLNSSVKSYLLADEISMGHARALLALNVEEQQGACEYIIEKNLSVRETESYIATLVKGVTQAKDNDAYSTNEILSEKVKSWEGRVSSLVDSKSKISFDRKGRAKLTIYAETEDDLERIIAFMDK